MAIRTWNGEGAGFIAHHLSLLVKCYASKYHAS
jgi:hypothetical protein